MKLLYLIFINGGSYDAYVAKKAIERNIMDKLERTNEPVDINVRYFFIP